MSVRLRRLKADYDKLCTIFTQKSRIRIKKTLGDPPEKYQLEYLVSGMEKKLDGTLTLRSNFLVEITLTGSYPRMAPQCKMLTPVFHPNIAPHAICIGDHWAAGEALAQLVIRIAEMLSYQSYNVQSPLNGEAAKWVEENKDKIPLDSFDFSSLLSIGEATSSGGAQAEGGVCANCGKAVAAADSHVCINQHIACSNCALTCAICNSAICLKCPLMTCAVCKKTMCQNCSYKCGSCGHIVCTPHQGKCVVCNHVKCTECLVDCAACGKSACTDHITKVTVDGQKHFECTTCHPVAT